MPDGFDVHGRDEDLAQVVGQQADVGDGALAGHLVHEGVGIGAGLPEGGDEVGIGLDQFFPRP